MLTRQKIILRSCVLGVLIGLAHAAIAQSTPAPKPHKDLQSAVTATAISRDYYTFRTDCMFGDVNKMLKKTIELNKTRPKDRQFSTPPVGELCVALVKHSADVQKDEKLLAERPEKALITPYLAMLAGQGVEATGKNALNLIAAYTSLLSKPETQSQRSDENTAALLTTAPGKKFALTTGVAFDVSFVEEVIQVKQNNKIPARPANSKALYDTTQACFAGNTQMLGACVKAAKDQAAIYLNDAKR